MEYQKCLFGRTIIDSSDSDELSMNDKIELEYYDIDGNQKVETFEGFESTVLSHELDHLDGILHIDIAEEVIEMPANERKKWRQSHEYKIYQKDGDYDSLRDKGKKKVLR